MTYIVSQDSVLQLKKKEACNVSSTDKSDENALVYFNVPPTIKQDIQYCRQQLIDAILSYESIIEGLEDLWNSKVNYLHYQWQRKEI